MQPEEARWKNPRLFLAGGVVFLFAVLTYVSVKARSQQFQQAAQLSNSEIATPEVFAAPLPFVEHKNHKHLFMNLLIVVLAIVLVAGSLLLVHFFPIRGFSVGTASVVAPREFQKGIIYPRWHKNAYGLVDTTWQTGIRTIKEQTNASWIEMPVLFSQQTSNATVVQVSQSTASIEAFNDGVHAAHALGYRVFFVPLMKVQQPGGWSGSIQPPVSQLQTWFDSYWNTLQPYVEAAKYDGVEQMAIATELQTLQQYAPAPYWNQLITREHSIFQNTLTYDMNWSSLALPPPNWLKNSGLAMIGVSSYIPLLDTATRIDPQAMPALWAEKVKSKLDAFASQIEKPVLITEIGYRNSTDALYHTWEVTTKAPADPQEQAGAYNAALSNVSKDPQIAGTFFWGWDDVGQFAIKGLPAVQILQKWYSQS